MRRAIRAALRIGVVAVVSAAAFVHVELISSSPEDGETFVTSPGEIRLVFSAPVEPDLSVIRLITEDGARLTLRPQVGDEGETLFTALPGLGNGRYRVEWSTVSSDGHKAEGTLAFVVQDDTKIEPPAAHEPHDETPTGGHGHDTPLALVRGLAVAALLAFGGLLFHARGVPVTGVARALGGAAAVMLAVHAYLWLRSVSPTGSVDGGVLSAALATTGGRLELARLGLAALAAVSLSFSSRTTALALAFLAILSGAAIGHAAEYTPLFSILLKALHLVAVAVWLGGLLMLVMAAASSETFRPIAHRVSSRALWAVIAIIVTGLVQSILIVGSPMALLGTRYGALLATKSVGLIGLLWFGVRHRFRLLPGIDAGGGPEKLQRSVRFEMALLVLVVLVAGVLAATPPPR